MKTEDEAYTARLSRVPLWKRVLDVQAPYRWNLRRQHFGRTLEIGCGVGRVLASLDPGSVGVDHNPASVAAARARGLTAYLPAEVPEELAPFDSLLLSHVVEHMTVAQAKALVLAWTGRVRQNGTLALIVPQERGFASDPTHVERMDEPKLLELAAAAGATDARLSSFPFPRFAGRFFVHNELMLTGRLP